MIAYTIVPIGVMVAYGFNRAPSGRLTFSWLGFTTEWYRHIFDIADLTGALVNSLELAADVVISADGAMWRIDEPSLTLSSRGLAGLELTLTGPSKDLHSGRHGGGVRFENAPAARVEPRAQVVHQVGGAASGAPSLEFRNLRGDDGLGARNFALARAPVLIDDLGKVVEIVQVEVVEIGGGRLDIPRHAGIV